VNLAIEVRTDTARPLIEEVSRLEEITGVILVEHDGDVTA
jgi:hypothetical protein